MSLSQRLFPFIPEFFHVQTSRSHILPFTFTFKNRQQLLVLGHALEQENIVII